MEVAGAAIATVTAQIMVTAVLVAAAGKDKVLFPHLRLIRLVPGKFFKVMIKVGLPSGIQSMIYSMISMVLTLSLIHI